MSNVLQGEPLHVTSPLNALQLLWLRSCALRLYLCHQEFNLLMHCFALRSSKTTNEICSQRRMLYTHQARIGHRRPYLEEPHFRCFCLSPSQSASLLVAFGSMKEISHTKAAAKTEKGSMDPHCILAFERDGAHVF